MSDDGRFAVVVIALVGNPFSSAYARAGAVRPLDHCAMNVVVYGPAGASWSLTERRIVDEDRTAEGISIGSSEMRWSGDALLVRVDETCAPFGGRIHGTIRFVPDAMPGASIALHEAHRWWPVAPSGRIDVHLGGLRFTGRGYHDANAGDAPLPSAFEGWTWSRAHDDGMSIVAYDSTGRDGMQTSRLLAFDAAGRVREEESRTTILPRTRWGLARTTRGDDARIVRSLEDGPCYARALVETKLLGRRLVTMHETLSCDRLAARWVRFLMPFRTRRAK